MSFLHSITPEYVPMNFEFKWLEDFITLAVTKNFSNAAKQRFVTQSAFSRRIKSLEESLDTVLVNRNKMPIELTEAGQAFLITAKNVMAQLHETVQHMHHLNNNLEAVLQFSAAHSLTQNFFPQWLARLRKHNISFTSHLVAANVGESTHALREGNCDFMLVYYDPETALRLSPDLFPWLTLGQTKLVPVCGYNTEQKPIFNIDNTEESFPLLTYSQNAFLGHSVNQLLRQSKLNYVKSAETDIADSLKGMAIEGLGVAWLPLLSIENELARKELVICGENKWFIPLEIRLYHCVLIKKPTVFALWKALKKITASSF